MKRILSLLVLISAIVSAQNHRFVYDYQYVPNIKEKESTLKDLMALDISDNGSVYQSLSRMEFDSIRKAETLERLSKNNGGKTVSISFGPGGGKKGSITDIITKTYPNYEIFLTTFIENDKYKISDSKKMDWKIGSETQKIMNYTAQKATTSFGGRDWVAWFTTELPFPDGPYKFHGLPGLIVKLEDTSGSHVMTLIANKKIAEKPKEEDEQNINGTIISFGGKEIPVTEEKFKKLWKDYVKDPAKEIRKNGEGYSEGDNKYVFVYEDKNGNKKSIKDVIREKEESVKRRLEKDNNKIEPQLYN